MKHTGFMRIVSIITAVIMLFCLSGCSPREMNDVVIIEYEQSGITGAINGALTVHFIDVGQGDSTFIELPNGETMLIDAGERDRGESVVAYINSAGYNKIDYLIGTHPHSDHIGGMAQVVNSLNIGTGYMPNVQTDTATFENLLIAIKNKGMKIKTAKAGVTIISGDLTAEILSPVDDEYDNLNNYSAVIRITYGSTSFLFMGDVERQVESEITADVSADVIKVGHHGSDTSSSSSFISRVGASIAVISVGEGNSYGHPDEGIMSAWEKSGAAVMRTDLLGTIIIGSNGKEITTADGIITPAVAESERESETEDEILSSGNATEHNWLLNTSSKKIHYPDCAAAENISEKNKKYSNKSLSELLAEGYTPCGNCRPS